MADDKIIGIEQEAKFYTISGYKLKMIPISDLTLPEADRVMRAIGSIRDFGAKTLIEGLVEVYGKILGPVLRFDDEGLAVVIRFLMRTTPLSVLARRASVKEVGTIVEDFFVLNFGSTQPSVASLTNSMLSFHPTGSRPSTTSSIP